jgi:poly-gamma-glutamate synthesis protein (capsule biosynthesis protein)
LNYTYGTNGIPVPSPTIVNPIDTAMIRVDIKKAKVQEPDAIIVFVHWGTDYEALPRKSEKNVAEFCFAHGADLVIGSHPHVLQPIEWRKDDNKLVVYSLGNFVSGQRKRYTDGGTMAYVELKKVRDNAGSITTSIDSASYLLNWVYRTVDDKKDYYVMPAPSFEKDTRFIKDATSKSAMKEFISDSRILYGKHNIRVGEIKITPPDSVITYKVLLAIPEFKPNAVSSIDSSLVIMIDPFYGLEVLIQDNVDPTFIIGPFTNPLKAEEVCQQFIRNGRQALLV